MEDIANRPTCSHCGALMVVGPEGWTHPYPNCVVVLTRLATNTNHPCIHDPGDVYECGHPDCVGARAYLSREE